jgi:hypothetical protein
MNRVSDSLILYQTLFLIPLHRVGDATLAQGDRDNVPHGLVWDERGIGVLKDDLRRAVKVSRNVGQDAILFHNPIRV